MAVLSSAIAGYGSRASVRMHSRYATTAAKPIRKVYIYRGHETHPLLGPYPENVAKRLLMFQELNRYRGKKGLKEWDIKTVAGEQLVETLKRENAAETLVVFTAGQSSRLEQVFSLKEVSFLKHSFFPSGGRGYFNCGSSYWTSQKRIYSDFCEEQINSRQSIVKFSQFALFQGIAEGPLCPHPGNTYKVGFFSDAVRIQGSVIEETTLQRRKEECTIFLSGGGSFILPKTSTQKISVLARYAHSELERLGKKKEEFEKWENAAILVSIGKGAALLSMFHPYYSAKDIDVELYKRTFPSSGTDWASVHARLSSTDIRMRFAYEAMLRKLEALEFD